MRIGIEAHQKSYRDYPVSTENPTLSLANLVDTLGQQFLWLPMTSRGKGINDGNSHFADMSTRSASEICGLRISDVRLKALLPLRDEAYAHPTQVRFTDGRGRECLCLWQ